MNANKKMKTIRFHGLCYFLLTIQFVLHWGQLALSAIELDQKSAEWIGKRIWQNECAGTIKGLTAWNKGEGFASLGIGHFIWFPAGKDFPYQESFPDLLQFAKTNGAKLPTWLQGATNPACPWDSRAEFYKDFNTSKMKELRSFLASTIALQARFAANRLERALPKMLESIPEDQRQIIQNRFAALASTPAGLYALMDYVNFKGEGTNPKERYQGKGWGLLQALALMPNHPNPTGPQALADFRQGATAALTRRTQLAPKSKQAQEKRWLRGWKNRIQSYR